MEKMQPDYNKYYEEAYNTSMQSGDVKKSSMLSKKITALFVAASVLVVTGTGIFLWDKINKQNKIDDYLEKTDYYSYIENNHWSNGKSEGYDHVDLASSIENSDNPDLALYTFYNHLTRKYADESVITDNMNEVIKRIDFNGDGGADCGSCEEYLKLRGFSSEGKYENAMKEIILKNVEIDEIEEQHDLGGKN